MFGRAASYRFVDVPTDGRYNLALSQSQLDSAYLYEKWVILLFIYVLVNAFRVGKFHLEILFLSLYVLCCKS